MKTTQQIQRKDLQEIFNKVCESWQKEIAQLVLFQSGDTIEVDNELIARAYQAADNKERKDFLKKHFKSVSNNITDQIDSFDGVLKLAGKKLEDVILFFNPKNKRERRANAIEKIALITEVVNQGHVFDWLNGNQGKYYPYFKKDSAGWAVGVCSYVVHYALLGSGFYYKDSKLALWAGEKFLDIYIDYLPE